MENNKKINNDVEYEINLFEYVIALLKRKRLVIGITFLFALAAVGITFIITPTYMAKTVIMPMQSINSTLSGASASSFKGIYGIPQSPFSTSNPNQLSIEILKSARIFDSVIEKNNLLEVYNVEMIQDARRILGKAVNISGESDQLLKITVEGPDPELCATIANSLVAEYESLMRNILDTQLTQRKLYLEEHFKRVKLDLADAEDAMRNFQEETGAVSIDAQAQAVIMAISRLNAQITSKEVELEVMKSFTTSMNPDRQKLEEQIYSLRKQVKKLEEQSDPSNPVVSTENMPEIELEYLRRMRELEFQEALFRIVAQQYETVRAEELMNTTLIQVIDKAVTPEKRIKPQKTKIVIVITFLGFIFSVIFAIFLENVEKLSQHPEKAHLIEEFKRHLSFRRR